MDTAPTQNIGDIAVDWKTGTIWVGTGEILRVLRMRESGF
jgi:hypothetical protein